MNNKQMPLITAFHLRIVAKDAKILQQDESKPKYAITGKVGGMKSSPNHSQTGEITDWTVTFAILEAAALPGTPPLSDPLPPDVPVRITVVNDPVIFNSYVAEAVGAWDKNSSYFQADEVRVQRLGTVLHTAQRNKTLGIILGIVFLAFVVVMLGWIAFEMLDSFQILKG